METPQVSQLSQIDGESMTDEELSPIEQVRLTVTNTDDPTLPVLTFRVWFLGLLSCAVLSGLNAYNSYRAGGIVSIQAATVLIGRFLAAVLPTREVRVPGFGSKTFSLNPGPFNVKEHVLISVFANSGCSFGWGTAYAMYVVNIAKVFYRRDMSFLAAWILIMTTQMLGYGWAGLLRKYVIEPAHMWWPTTVAQVAVFRAFHEKDDCRMSRSKFFLIAAICSFSWYVVPGYLFQTLTYISWVCWAFPNSVTAQQIGSGMRGLGLGAITLDWSTISLFLSSPLIQPFFAIVNIFIGYVSVTYIVIPIAYWGLDLYSAKRFPIISPGIFTSQGQTYDLGAIVEDNFELDLSQYGKQGKIYLSMYFALCYGFGFAAIASTLTHVGFFYGRQITDSASSFIKMNREIYQKCIGSYKGKEDIHTRMMRRYKEIPNWWFHVMLGVTVAVSLVLFIFLNDQVQMPFWGFLFACALGFIFTLPISMITAMTNQTPGLNVVTEYIMGLILPGKPIANVCFKAYGFMSMAQAVSFLNDFKLGHYMKIPPRLMFLVQFLGTILAGTINLGVAWWLLGSIKNICHEDLQPPNSPWTCPDDRVFFDASVIWGLVGPKRIFGKLGNYSAMNWFFLGGAVGPFIIWLFHKAFPEQSWIPLINIPVLLGATTAMPPATTLTYNAWLLIGTIFNFFVFRYRKRWWQRYNYILSAALDAGVAFMGVLLYFTVGLKNINLDWWGTQAEHCALATCPTAKGIVVDGCPVK
ncbi:Oligopeptide transporter, OPT superfamily [Dillenia turbinata]|uniref:Oligopeptide transporter, OPT superfamily n=1 Tax=Dillenia turbinata TaxID=194707 RepID=A0AAN8W475_9MAGN